jgi:uncharacterized membrane protein
MVLKEMETGEMGAGQMSLNFVSKARVISMGRAFFALGLIGIGVQHFYFRQLVPMVVPAWPAWIPGRLFWVFLVGTILIAGGAAILAGIKAGGMARLAATLLGVLFFLSFLLLHVPANLRSGLWSVEGWADALTALTLAGGGLVVAGTLPQLRAASGRGNPVGWFEELIPLGMYPLAIMIIVFGIDHFLHVAFVSTLVPAWIPWPVFWTRFAGTALIAAGVAMIVRVKAPLAATLLGTMLLTWVAILHIPRAIADPYSGVGGEWTSVFEALAESGIAFILGETLVPRRPAIVTANNPMPKQASASD